MNTASRNSADKADQLRTGRQMVQRFQLALIGLVVDPEARGRAADPDEEKGQAERRQSRRMAL